MKQFKEFRMPPITMGRDNTIVGVRDHDIPGSEAQQEQLKKAKDALKKKFTFKSTGKLKAALKKYSGMDAAKKLAEKELAEGGRLEFDMSKMNDGDKKKLIDLVQSLQFKRDHKLTQASVSMGKYLHIKAGYNDLDKAKKSIEKAGFKSPDLTRRSASKITMEGKITWQRGLVSDGTMKIGIFDGDKEKALEAARQLIIFLRKNKRVKIGGDKEDTDGEPNEAIAKYSEELSKLIFDDDLLDSLEPDGNNADQTANDIVLNRLRDLGVNIR